MYRIGDDGGGSADVNDEELNALLETTAAAIGKRIDGLFQFVAEVRARVDDVAARAAEHRKPLDRTALATIRPLVQNILQRDEPLLEGIGVAVGREALVDTPRWLEWWRRDTADSSHFVRHILNPDAVGFYDYQSREWFVHPIEQQRPLAIGPYVDAGGIEVCTVTLTMPLPLATGDVSVVGGDLSIPAMEHLLLESLGTLRPPIALVAANDRVIVSNSARYVTGSRLRPNTTVVRTVPVPSPDPERLRWRLLVLDNS
ncbi:hypothetical protein CJ179_11225 [Rhodococcus sp. ACS1]|nr:hypothetical protein CJ179_11225 [Rhodococcus sp. ACS1]